MAQCWICGGMADKWNIPPARMCTNCWSAGPDLFRRLDFGVVYGKSGDGRTVEIEAPPKHAPTRFQLVFRAETYGTIVKKLVKRELQVGIQEVDDQVYFQYAEEDDLFYLRGYEVSHLMAELSKFGTTEIDGARALVHVQDASASLDLVAQLTGSLLHFISDRQALPAGSG